MPRKQKRPPHPSDDTLVRLIEPSTLRKLAGTRSFERGEEYAADGAVTQIVEDRGTVAAKVQGTRAYRVSITADVDRLAFACNCPRGDDGDFCKHCVAVCLAWLDQRQTPIASSPVGTMGNVRDWLARQPTETLVGMIVEQAMESDELLRRLTLAAGRQSGKGLHLQRAMALLDAATAAGDFVPYAEAHSYANGILEALEVIPQFLDQGRASEALALAEHAIDLVGSDLPVDDSDGYLSDVFERTIDLHLAACRKAKPDPEALAAKVLQWELSDGMGMFDNAVDRYERVLGKKGMAAYRRLAEERWNAASSAKGAEKNYVLTSIMEGLATKAGDVEALVAVRMRDLSQPWSYAQIARDYLQAGKHEEALEWGEKGLAAFPQQWNDGGLRELVADEYHRLQRHDDAMKLIWSSFVRTPGLSSYEPLRTHARRAGDWPAWRTKALDTIRRSISSTTKVRNPWHSPRGRSELVRIFLWENDVDAAWREAEEGGCSNDLWLQLAAKREKSHPADALRVYLEQVEPAVKSSTGDYGESIRLLEKARSIADRLDRTADFRALIARLRTQHRRRRNLQKRLDQKNGKGRAGSGMCTQHIRRLRMPALATCCGTSGNEVESSGHPSPLTCRAYSSVIRTPIGRRPLRFRRS